MKSSILRSLCVRVFVSAMVFCGDHTISIYESVIYALQEAIVDVIYEGYAVIAAAMFESVVELSVCEVVDVTVVLFQIFREFFLEFACVALVVELDSEFAKGAPEVLVSAAVLVDDLHVDAEGDWEMVAAEIMRSNLHANGFAVVLPVSVDENEIDD